MVRPLDGPRCLLSLVVAAALIGGCSTQPPSPPPLPPVIQTVGILAEERIADPDRTYVLADGRTIQVSIEVTRVLFEGGLGQPFVAGTDASGPFVAVFAHQDGLPDDCHIPGIGAFGIERGSFIEIKGVLWHKAAAFRSARSLPAFGEQFDASTRFCFDDQAEVMNTVP